MTDRARIRSPHAPNDDAEHGSPRTAPDGGTSPGWTSLVTRAHGRLGEADEATVVSGFGVVWTVIALLLLEPIPFPLPLALSLCVVFGWLLFSAPVAFVITIVGTVAVPPGGDISPQLIPAVAGLLIMLFGTLRRTSGPIRALVAGAVAFGVLVLLLLFVEPLPLAAVVITALGATTTYLLHRLELIRLGLLEEPTEGEVS